MGAVVGAAAAFVMPTSHADARAMAAALAPAYSDASPTGDIDFPFWYGGGYQATQVFTGGARDREDLTSVMSQQLDRHGWRIVGVNVRPGATLITATQDDLEVVVHARHLPPTEPVECLISVTYLYEPPFWALVAVGMSSGAVAAVRGYRSSVRTGGLPSDS